MKLGETGESFFFIVMINDMEWEYCIHPDTNDELRFDNWEDAVKEVDVVMSLYDSQKVFLIREIRQVIVDADMKAGDFYSHREALDKDLIDRVKHSRQYVYL